MNWIQLNSVAQLEEIDQKSVEQAILLFKHSTRCAVSAAALNRLERNWQEEEMKQMPTYFLDLIAHREISNKIVEKYGVEHQSPQLLVIRNGKSIYDTSHLSINYSNLKSLVLPSLLS